MLPHWQQHWGKRETVPDSDLLCTCAPMHRCPCIAACKPHPPGGESCHYTRTRCLQNDVCKEQRMGRPSYIHTGALWQQRAQAHATCRAAQNEVPGRAEHHSVHGFMWLCYSVLYKQWKHKVSYMNYVCRYMSTRSAQLYSVSCREISFSILERSKKKLPDLGLPFFFFL